MIDRRKLMALLGRTMSAWPPELRRQEPERTYGIGTRQNSPRRTALYDELSRLGFVASQ